MKEVIQQLLTDSVTAPSPDNYQPWRFEVTGNSIAVFKVPGLVNHLLDYDQHVLLLTNGMLLENMTIAASHYGYRAIVQYLPGSNGPDCVATVTLEKSEQQADSLYAFLHTRCTNRKPYRRKKIEPAILEELKKTALGYPGTEVSIVADPAVVKKLGQAVSVIDQVMFENQALHDSLFEHITWTREEEQRTHVGLNLDSMEFKLPEKWMFRVLKKWGVVRALNHIGFSKFVRFKNTMQYGSGAAAALGSVNSESPHAYLVAGRLMQRFWLQATAHGLSLHPIVGAIYCYQKVTMERSELFSPTHAQWLIDNYAVLQAAASTKGSLVFFFRMGYAAPTTYQSTRKAPEIQFLS